MAKRRKTIYAGRLVYDVIYTIPSPRDDEYVRGEIKKISAEAIAKVNCTTATRKLELLMAANFEPQDLVISLTYSDEHLPPTYKDAQKKLQTFLRHMRNYRKARGQDFKYIYVSEGKHGDHRLHHHIILNATENDLETIRSMWHWGEQVDLKYIRDHGYEKWAYYLAKERREAALNGKRMFVPSRGLIRPEIDYQYVDDATTIEVPIGAIQLSDSADRNEYASYKYIKYILPEVRPTAKTPKQHIAIFKAGLKSSVTSKTSPKKSLRGTGQGVEMNV